MIIFKVIITLVIIFKEVSLQKIPNVTIRSKMKEQQSILYRNQRRQLKWYGYLLRMKDSRCPKKIYQWTPDGRRRRGRTK